MKRLFLSLSVAPLALFPAIATAQQDQAGMAFVQIEALPTLEEAQTNAARFALSLPDVVGYDLSAKWHVIALGPYPEAEAEQRLRSLLNARAIPSDSFIVDGSRYITQFFPTAGTAAALEAPVASTVPTTSVVSAPLTNTAQETPPTQAAAEPETQTAPANLEEATTETPEAPEVYVADETPREARASERELSREEKKELQRALKWAGVYTGAIDGLYGRGTRRSMENWQEAQGMDETGILTTGQRAQLLAAYNAILEPLALETVRNEEAGVEMLLPTAAVEFSRFDAPFVRFDGTGLIENGQVLMISQNGDRDTLRSLFEVLQTLAIVPTQGERNIKRNSFTIEGISERLHTTIDVRLEDGAIKGFALVWPANDEERRARLLSKMRTSFTPIPGILAPTMISAGAEVSTDMVSGLAIRKPLRVRSGIFVTSDGAVLSSGDAAQGCGEVTLDSATPLRVLAQEDSYTLFAPETAVAPQRVAAFAMSDPALDTQVALAGYPYGGILPTAALTFGTLDGMTGLAGETDQRRLALRAQDSEFGGPISDTTGAIIGMLNPAQTDGKILPEGVSFALSSAKLVEIVEGAGLSATRSQAGAEAQTPEQLTLDLPELTALITCWE